MTSALRSSEHDRRLIRDLACQVAEIAALPVQAEKRAMWVKLNRLEPVRPMVWINEIPWDEIQDDELRCQAEDEFGRGVESELRTTLYLWRHMRTDMVVDPVFYSRHVYHDSGYGLEVQSVPGRVEDSFGAEAYVPILHTEADLERIALPVITADWPATERRYQMTCDLVGDVLAVEKQGVGHMWCAPWDTLVRWWGTTELYRDLRRRPAFVHAGIARMMEALLARLDQLEAQGLLSVTNGNHRVGSGGLGITDELPQPDYAGGRARPLDQWGTSTGQIFTGVSPAMHDEFCLQYELRWLERFGLNCYGCCEPLHHKIKMLRQIPRLRRISMSPWADIAAAAAEVKRDYIFSHKPHPAVFAWETWDPERARQELCRALDQARGCVVEIIMKDISTCRRDPRRLWEWCTLAMDVAEEYA